MLKKDDKDAQIAFLKKRILKIKCMMDGVFVNESSIYNEYYDTYDTQYEVCGIDDIKDLCDKTLMDVTF